MWTAMPVQEGRIFFMVGEDTETISRIDVPFCLG